MVDTVPTAQATHEVDPTTLEYWPFEHIKHVGAAGTLMYSPVLHNVHEDGPPILAVELDPAGQVRHPVRPVVLAKKPAAQNEHDTCPAWPTTEPVGHGSQLDFPVVA